MDEPAKPHGNASLSDFLAAERTLLAWIRTGLALMGFGFVAARFGLFLQEFQAFEHTIPAQPLGLSLWFGTVLIGVGVIVNIFAGWHHARLVRQLNRGETPHSHPSNLAVAIAFFLALVGLTMVIYLVILRHSTRSQPANGKETAMTSTPEKGIIKIPGHHLLMAAARISSKRTFGFSSAPVCADARPYPRENPETCPHSPSA